MIDPIKVLLAIEYPLMCSGIRFLLTSTSDITFAGETFDGHGVQLLSQELDPNVLLLDVNIPGPPILEVVNSLRTRHAEMKVVLLISTSDSAYIRRLLSAGVTGYILKSEMAETLLRAIRSVMQGDVWLSQSIAQQLIDRDTGLAAQPNEFALTDRQLGVLRLVVEGKTNKEISVALKISEKTVEKHLNATFGKLGVMTRVEAAVLAVQTGITAQAA